MSPLTRRLAVLLGAALVAGAAVEPPWLLVNESRSLPRGVYLRRPGPPVAGAVVALPVPPAGRGYLAALGAGSRARLLKRVAVAEGTVCAVGGRLRWPGGEARILARDRQGRPLPDWRGCRRLAPGELLLLGDTAASFDSRYFGPVPVRAVDGVYRRILPW